MTDRMEILAPAGSFESLQAAVRCGADAVYLGGRALNARRNADNFDKSGLQEAVSFCHQRGVKVYLTLNTLIFDDELGELVAALREACAAGVDAVIVQDLAVAALVRRWAPSLPLHASTQMSVHNLAGALVLEQLGFSRVVLAREMEAGEIRAVVQGTGLAVECFVHGALCMCVSGQCTLSSMIGGRSGNRGLCAQPCRLPFSSGATDHALSLRDLSLIGQIPLLEELGVTSLKIEGRMKRPEYVAAVTTACRAALDGEEIDQETLEAVFSRSGFTDGYLTGERGSGMFGIRQKEDVTAASPKVLAGLRRLYDRERQSVPVSLHLEMKVGKPSALTAQDADGNCVEVSGDLVQQAMSAPTTAEKAEAALSKTGGTVYTICNISTNIDENSMMPASQLNALRRTALEQLDQKRSAPRPQPFAQHAAPPIRSGHIPQKPMQLRARLHRAEQFTKPLFNMMDQMVLPVEELIKLSPGQIAGQEDRILVELPRIMFDNQEKLAENIRKVKQMGVSRALVGHLYGLRVAGELGFQLHGDFGLNITNSVALEAYAELGVVDATVSFELERPRLQALGGGLPRGILAWGHLPLMTMRNCPVSAAQGGCADCGRCFPELTDRKNVHFFVDCSWQVASLYNHVPLFLGDRLQEFDHMDFVTLYFTREPPEECVRIARIYREGMPMEGEKTRGLYYRKVL